MPGLRQRVGPHILLLVLGLAAVGLHATAWTAPGVGSVVAVGSSGSQLDHSPSTLPTAPIPPDADVIDLAGERVRQGNLVGATALLEDWLGGGREDLSARDGRRRWYGARFLLGLLHMRQGQYNLASNQFTKVRAAKGALASEAAYREALADQARGRHAVAGRECAKYRELWPRGSHAEDCLLLSGQAYTDAGYFQPAHEAYQEFIDLDPDGPDAEIALLGKALAQVNRSKRQGVVELQAMALDYSYPTTRIVALQALAELEAEGLDTTIPDDRASRMRLAFSSLRAREYDQARALWQALQEDPEAESWVREHRETFGWRTRDYASLVAIFAERYQANRSADTAWMAHRAASRGGLWQDAATWGEQGMKQHSGHWRWRAAHDDVAWAWMLAGEHAKAQVLWDQVATRGGGKGRQGAWFGAFCAWRAGDLDDATTRLEAIRGKDSARATRALYYLGRVAEARGEVEQAAELYRGVLSEDPMGWYGLLAATRLDPATAGEPWLQRSGDWPYPLPSPPPELGAVPVVPPPTRVQAPPARQPLAPPARSFAAEILAWQALPAPEPVPPPSTGTVTAAAAATPALTPGEIPPTTVVEGPYYDPASARKSFARFTHLHKSLWPELQDVYLLSEVGAYDLAGELMARVYDEIEQGQRGRGPRAAQVKGVDMRLSAWRELFLFCRAWHLVSRFGMGLHKYADDDEQRRQALALAYPAAFPEHVWRSGREHDIDPLLVLAVMRQESHYKSWAVSSADAQGLMQILPVTGAGVARDLGVARYSPRDLMDPSTNIHYGAWYLHQLTARFQGALPLAVAAYNAGPQAVGAWLAAQDQGVPVDDFVEMIPVPETRDYVRRVLGFYSLYTQVHGPDGARVVMSLAPPGDDPTVIDY